MEEAKLSGFPVNTNCDNIWDLLRNWLATCELRHSKCVQRVPSKLQLPTRILDVGGLEDNHVWLITTDAQCEGRYITLSHCWGDDAGKIIKLTSDTIIELSTGIDDDALPLTYRDAVVATRELGCRFLWIDSLCIMQDSEKEWQHEAGRMDAVYGNAYCNIGATSSANPEGGLFQERLPAQMELQIFEAEIGTVGRRKLTSYHSFEWDRRLGDSRLLRRAWVVQERILARRMIHFSQGEVFWECLQHSACEQFPEGIPRTMEYLQTKGQLADALWARGSQISTQDHRYHLDVDEEKKSVQTCWMNLLEEYTKCQISREEDRLPAISGLAKLMVPTLGEYLAGLWSYDLAYQLLWWVPVDAGAVHYPSHKRSPSWSWVAVEGHIKWDVLPEGRQLFKLELAHIDPIEKENPFGQIQDARLRLRGHLFPVLDFVAEEGTGSVKLRFDPFKMVRTLRLEICIDVPEPEEHLQTLYNSESFFFPVRGQDRMIDGLFLKRVDATSPDGGGSTTRYERKGTATIFGKEEARRLDHAMAYARAERRIRSVPRRLGFGGDSSELYMPGQPGVFYLV